MAQNPEDFEEFLRKMGGLQMMDETPRISDTMPNYGAAWKQAILDGSNGDTGTGLSLPEVDHPSMNAPARMPSWAESAAPMSEENVPGGGGPLRAELGQALIGAPAPMPSASPSGLPQNPHQPSRSIQGPDTPITASAPNMGSQAPFSMEALNKLFDPEMLVSAQEQSRKNRMGTGIFQALAQGAATATGTKMNEGLWNNLNESANSPLTDLQNQQAGQAKKMQALNTSLDMAMKQDSNDPTTPWARVAQKLAGEIATKAGLKIEPEVLAKMAPRHIDDIQKEILNVYDMKYKADTLKASKSEKADHHLEDKLDKAEQKLKDNLNVEKASSRSAVGKAAINRNLAERAEALFDSYKDKNGKIDFNKIDPQRGYEIVRTLDNLVSSSGATISGSDHLVPSSALGDASQWMNYVRNQPGGANQGKFFDNIYHTIQREKDVSVNQARRFINDQIKLEDGGMLQKHRPDRLKHYQDVYGGNLSDGMKPHEGAESFTPDVLKYAETHGISPEQANQIKIQRTGGH